MAHTTRITVSAEATVDCPAERAVITFRRQNLYDNLYDRPTHTGSELSRLVIDAGAEDIKVLPAKGKVSITIADLTTLGSVLANLRNLGPVKKPNTSFEVSDETHELLVAEATSYAVEQARASVEPTKRMLHAESVSVVEVKVRKTKAVAGTWNQLSSRALHASAYVKVDVTFDFHGTSPYDIGDQLREYYDDRERLANEPERDIEAEHDAFSDDLFAGTSAAARDELADSVGVTYKHTDNGSERGVSLDADASNG
ncbi:hypothetical protein ACWGJ9_08705 [Curtobacterium citreum]